MNQLLRYVLILFLVIALVLVRKYEITLFYDPFLEYFHGKIGRAYYPDYNITKVLTSIVFRYVLNSVISLLIIGLIFLNKKYISFSSVLYALFLIILLPVYVYLVKNYFELGENMGFYIRRFLIQPIFLLILIPAFFYLKINTRKNNLN